MPKSTDLTKLSIHLLIPLIVLASCAKNNSEKENEILLLLQNSIEENILGAWYPVAVDKEDGGFYSNLNASFEVEEEQPKMIVSQARHIWVNSRAYNRYPEIEEYKLNAEQGFHFLKNKMWDKEEGGFYSLVEKNGLLVDGPNSTFKTSYGNSFAIYGLAEYYLATGDEEALKLAIDTFHWLEKGAYDPEYGGYFQDLLRSGKPRIRPKTALATSTIGLKDYNSSIHILEAYTKLYKAWPDSLLQERLMEMLRIARDEITTEKGYMELYFTPSWKPVSFRDSTVESILKKFSYIDHVSPGHDVETAYLMLEADYELELYDEETKKVAKKMVDHALANLFDNKKGGFFDGGYYFRGSDTLLVTKRTKNWWAQAEGLNALMLMYKYYPADEMNYFEKFTKQWDYINTNLIDHENGGWYQAGVDVEPEYLSRRKGQIWKTPYHTYRALENVITQMENED